MDFHITTPTLFWTFFDVLIYVVVVGMFYDSFCKLPSRLPLPLFGKSNGPALLKKGTRVDSLLFFLLLVMCVTVINSSDWFTYKSIVQEYDFSPGAQNYGEPIYGLIIKLVGQNYILFRTVVWGLALLIFCGTIKRFGCSPNYALFIMLCVFFLKFCYARATVSMACYFYGLSFLLIRDRKPLLIRILLSAGFMLLAYCFHRSAVVMIASTLVLLLPLNLWTLLTALIIVPFLSSLVKSFLPALLFLEVGGGGSAYMQNKVGTYVEMEQQSLSLMGIVMSVLDYVSFCLPIIVTLVTTIIRKAVIPGPIISMEKVAAGLAIGSLIPLFLGIGSLAMFYRVLYMSFIPVTIVLAYLVKNRMIRGQLYRAILFCGILFQLYRLTYSFYTVIR